jgi:outer membrane lipoprotein-sorting protein
MTTSGTYNYSGVVFPYTAYSKAPNLYKYEVPFNGKSFIQAYNGKTGWRIDGFKNEKTKTLLKGKAGTAMANEADVELESPFINYKEKGYTLLLQGTDTINNRTCYKIKLDKKGDTAVYYFDNIDYALVKKQAISKNTEMENAPMDILYSNYQSTGNIKIPHTITCSTGGQKILTITVNTVKLNDPMPDSMFQP